MRGWRTIPALKGFRVALMFPKKPSPHLTISMVLEGCTNRPFYTIQARNNLQAANEPGIEQLGSWDPLVNSHGEQLVGVNVGRMMHWMAHGAMPSPTVAKLLGLVGVLPIHPSSELEALRLGRKLSAAASVKAAGTGAGDAKDG